MHFYNNLFTSDPVSCLILLRHWNNSTYV